MNSVSTSATSAERSTTALDDKNFRRFVPLLVAILWTLVIMGLCWVPGRLVGELDPNSIWARIPNLDKYIHAGIFIIFAILWMHVEGLRRRLATVFVAGCALAVLTEVVQEIAIVGRDGNIPDTTVDVVGLIVGLVIAVCLPFPNAFSSSMFSSRQLHKDEEPRT